ncbi:MAG: putative lipid II flippase FtsW [Candidatus Sungbacteria bacterium]|nr:putative lipid II flippase FtsW [Candidatus Sungbacteria bacterium]
MERMPRTIDLPLLFTTIVLLLGGFLVLASASMVIAEKNFGSLTYYTARQLFLGGLLGAVACFIASRISYRVWRTWSPALMLIAFILLALLFVPSISYSVGGATRWLTIYGISFQPSEFLKFAFIIYLASWLDARRREAGTVSYGMIPFAIMLAIVSVFLAMQPDIGTLGIIALTALFLYFLGGGKVYQISTLAAFGVAVLYFLIQLAPYRLNRILVFLNPGTDPQGIGYQINQALIAIGSGGFWGLGFGKGLQKYHYLPEPMGDSIFAIYAEEMGLVGAFILIGAFLFFCMRGFLIAKKAPDQFGKLLAAGITVSITLQAFINMAAISGMLPLTGIPLPFVSYGGTSLAITLASVGVLLNISRYI